MTFSGRSTLLSLWVGTPDCYPYNRLSLHSTNFSLFRCPFIFPMFPVKPGFIHVYFSQVVAWRFVSLMLLSLFFSPPLMSSDWLVHLHLSRSSDHKTRDMSRNSPYKGRKERKILSMIFQTDDSGCVLITSRHLVVSVVLCVSWFCKSFWFSPNPICLLNSFDLRFICQSNYLETTRNFSPK